MLDCRLMVVPHLPNQETPSLAAPRLILPRARCSASWRTAPIRCPRLMDQVSWLATYSRSSGSRYLDPTPKTRCWSQKEERNQSYRHLMVLRNLRQTSPHWPMTFGSATTVDFLHSKPGLRSRTRSANAAMTTFPMVIQKTAANCRKTRVTANLNHDCLAMIDFPGLKVQIHSIDPLKTVTGSMTDATKQTEAMMRRCWETNCRWTV